MRCGRIVRKVLIHEGFHATIRRSVGIGSAARRADDRMIEGFSPKLQRRVRLFSHSSFAQWMRLEADPAVSTFCERPARLTEEPAARLVEF